MSNDPELLNVKFNSTKKIEDESSSQEESEIEDFQKETENIQKKANKANVFPTVEQLTSVADPFVESKPTYVQPKIIPLQEKPKYSRVEITNPREITKTNTPVANKPTTVSKLTVTLMILIIVLLISIIVLLILKPGKLRREVDNMKEQYTESQKQLKNYQLQIQQLKVDNQELDKARITALNQSNVLSKEIARMKEEERFLVKESEQFKKKPVSFKDQKKKQYDNIANPNGGSEEGTKAKEETVIEIAKFKDVANPDDDIPPSMEVKSQNDVGTIVFETPQEEDIDIEGVF